MHTRKDKHRRKEPSSSELISFMTAIINLIRIVLDFAKLFF